MPSGEEHLESLRNGTIQRGIYGIKLKFKEQGQKKIRVESCKLIIAEVKPFLNSAPPKPWRGGVHMPFVNIKLIEGVLSDSQKQEIITKVTDAMVSIEGENLRPVTWVVLEEVKSGDWGIGGKGYTTEDVKKIAAGE